MSKINLVLADLEVPYIESLSHYITTNYSTQIRVTTFSRIDALEHFFSYNSEEYDVFLSTKAVLDHLENNSVKSKLILLLSEEGLNKEDSLYPSIYKFQPGEKIAIQILDAFCHHTNCRVIRKISDKNTLVLGVYSPGGGSGKTSISLALAGKLADIGCSVLILSMEGLGSLTAPFHCTGNAAMSQIIISLKENPDIIGIKVESKITQDPNMGIFYLEPVECFAELAELSGHDLEKLIEGLTTNGKYDYILIDMETGSDHRILAAFSIIDKLILISVPDILSNFKTQIFIRHIQHLELNSNQALSEKIIPVINKYNGGEVLELTGNVSTKVYSLPFINNLWTFDGVKYIFDPIGSMRNSLTALAKDIRSEESRE